jgi:hypothetical protein
MSSPLLPAKFLGFFEAAVLHVSKLGMRVRIIKTPKGTVDGVEINLFHHGLTYDLPAPLAELLIVEGWAEPHLPGPPHQETENKPGPMVDPSKFKQRFIP